MPSFLEHYKRIDPTLKLPVQQIDEDVSADMKLVNIEEERVGDNIAYTVFYNRRPAGTAIMKRVGDDWLTLQGDIKEEFKSLGLDLLLLRKAEAIAMAENRAIRKTVG
jgi:hypothetical protein